MAAVPYARCRLFGHAWEQVSLPPVYPFRHRWPNTLCLHCMRCDAARFDVFDSYGSLAGRKYGYPVDYAIPRDEKPTTEELRLIIIRPRRKQ